MANEDLGYKPFIRIIRAKCDRSFITRFKPEGDLNRKFIEIVLQNEDGYTCEIFPDYGDGDGSNKMICLKVSIKDPNDLYNVIEFNFSIIMNYIYYDLMNELYELNSEFY